ncbi:MAG: helix-turn-helix transcriptional regulator [Deltaproteobacteria bacterium]|nr:helix-turn-helix transcriptional regulator [Deltaproteobacteria bacterium]
MKNHAAGVLRDAIYDLELGEAAWLDALRDGFRPFVPDASLLTLSALRIRRGGLTLERVSPDRNRIRAFLALSAASVPHRQVRHILQRTSTVGSFSEWVKPLGVPNFWRTFAAFGLRMGDFLGVRAMDGGERFLSLSAWYPHERRMTEAQRSVLRPLAGHLATMFRLRRSLAGVPVRPERGEAVLEVSGRVVHAETEVASRSMRGRLREQVRRIESAKTAEGTRAGLLWTPLVEGRWTLIDCFDTDGRRYYVAVENAPPTGSSSALSEREEQVARMTAQGMSTKEIAYSLGLHRSTVSTYLERALEKLRIETRLDLPWLVEARAKRADISTSTLRFTEAGPDTHPGLTPAQNQIAKLAVAGKTDREIALLRGCSERTVANTLQATFRRTGVSTRLELARHLARRTG